MMPVGPVALGIEYAIILKWRGGASCQLDARLAYRPLSVGLIAERA